MFGNKMDPGEFYMDGIPDDVTECVKCHKPIDLENKSQYHLPWCTDCRTKDIRQSVDDYKNKRG